MFCLRQQRNALAIVCFLFLFFLLSDAVAQGCLSQPGTRITLPAQTYATGYSNTSVPAGAKIDARAATFYDSTNIRPVYLNGGSGICFYGGTVIGQYDRNSTWDYMHDASRNNGGVEFYNLASTIEATVVDNIEDGVRPRVDGFTVRSMKMTHIYDDCIDDHENNGGLIEDVLADGCYVAVSTRNLNGVDGSAKTLTIRDSLFRLEENPSPHSSEPFRPAHGDLFKTGSANVRFEIHNNIFLVVRDTGNAGMPPSSLITGCSNNTIVWLGGGTFPDNLGPAGCATVTTDPNVWTQAKNNWLTRHEGDPNAFNFSLSSSGNVALLPGGSGTNQITSTLLSGTSAAVTFSISGLPSGATSSFSPSNCAPNCSTVLTIQTGGTSPVGSYPITVTGTAGSISRSTQFTLSLGGGTTSSALINPSFENGQTGWLDWGSEEVIDGTTGADGTNSFHTYDSASATRTIYQDVDVEAGRNYLLGYSFKTKNVGTNQAHIHINWLGAAGDVLSSFDVAELHSVSGTVSTWDTRQSAVTAPLGAFKARVQLLLSPVTNGTPANDAEVWFDNFSFVPTGGTPPTPQNLRVEDS